MSDGDLSGSESGDTAVGDVTPSVLGADDLVELGELSLGPDDDLPTRDAVEPYLAALLQAEHFNLLTSSGLTTGLEGAARCAAGVDMNASLGLAGDLGTAIEQSAAASAKVTGRGDANIEDRLRVALAVSEGLRLIGDARAAELDAVIASALTSLRDSVASIEACLVEKVEDAVAGSMTLGGLLMTFIDPSPGGLRHEIDCTSSRRTMTESSSGAPNSPASGLSIDSWAHSSLCFGHPGSRSTTTTHRPDRYGTLDISMASHQAPRILGLAMESRPAEGYPHQRSIRCLAGSRPVRTAVLPERCEGR